MSVSFRLGNLTLNELTKRLGIELTEEHKGFLEASRVDKVSDSGVKNYKIAPDTWHAFKFPKTQIYAGSKKMANEVANILEQYMVDGAFPGDVASLIFTHEILEEEEFGYDVRKRIEEEGIEVYFGYNNNINKSEYPERARFFVKTRETVAGNIFLQEVNIKQNNDESWEYDTKVVPDLENKKLEFIYKKDKDDFTILDENGYLIKFEERFTKEIRKKICHDNTYLIKEFGATTELTKWDGNAKDIRSK